LEPLLTQGGELQSRRFEFDRFLKLWFRGGGTCVVVNFFVFHFFFCLSKKDKKVLPDSKCSQLLCGPLVPTGSNFSTGTGHIL
jgi:hypothetical protein